MSIGSAHEGGMNGARGSCDVPVFCYKAAMITSRMPTGLGPLAGSSTRALRLSAGSARAASRLVGLAWIGLPR